MDFGLSPEQEAIVEGVSATCRRFGDDYWRDCEAEARFPREFHRATNAIRRGTTFVAKRTTAPRSTAARRAAPATFMRPAAGSLNSSVEVAPQPVLVPLPSHLVAGAGAQLVRVDGPQHVVIGAEVEAAQHQPALECVSDEQHRQAGALRLDRGEREAVAERGQG